MEGILEKVMTSSFHPAYYSLVVFLQEPHLTFYNHMPNFFDMDGSINLDPHNNFREIHSLIGIELSYL